tara:strand:- start:341 stop:928 length:588 start_codon:yes stop_codon:yes gene_type:complete
MSKQLVCLVEFSELYNTLFEIKDVFSFNICHFEKTEDFLKELKIENSKYLNSLVILDPTKDTLLLNKNDILDIDNYPLKIDKLLSLINTRLIKQKYKFQSAFDIKGYMLNLNSRIMSNKITELKLTEREIDIILYLNDNDQPQSVQELQTNVWKYSFDDLETHTVETHIYRLRKKINNSFKDENFIISYEKGYKI